MHLTLHTKEDKIRRGWHDKADRHEKRKKHESVPRGARGEEKVNGDLLDR